jgi:hypothetical protein
MPGAGWYLGTHPQIRDRNARQPREQSPLLASLRPVQEKIIIVEHVLPLLGLDIVGE